MTRFNRLDLFFMVAGGLLLLFIILPLSSLILSTTPVAIIQVFTDADVVNAILLTFAASALATLLALLTGVPLAYLLARRKFWGKQMLEALVNLPVVIPHTAAGVALLMVFGRRGVLGSLFEPLGITFTDNLGGIVVAMLFVSLPFLVNFSREAFIAIEKELEQVAMMDGASSLQIFWSIMLPLAWRGIVSGSLMMWARGISEFGAVIILAYHPKIITVMIYELLEGFGLKAAQPVAALLILVALWVFVFMQFILLKKRDE